MLKDWIARGCLVAALNAGCPAWAVSAEAPSDPQLDRAELLIDSDYGDRRVLDDAAQLVSQSLARAPSARAYTQAAQIVIRGGHVVSERFQPGTQNLYRILIDRALAIDPQYAPALSLLFDAQLLDGLVGSACNVAKKGLAANPDYPWLHLKMARCDVRMFDTSAALKELDRIVKDGPGDGADGASMDQRLAFVQASLMQASLLAKPENVPLLRDIAARIETARDPRDAWTLGTMAQSFEAAADFDDAIACARKALAVMDYGVGEAILAAALYGKAAQLRLAHQDNAAVLAQARRIDVASDEVMAYFEDPKKPRELTSLAPVVQALLRH